jgi:hypothetical protein
MIVIDVARGQYCTINNVSEHIINFEPDILPYFPAYVVSNFALHTQEKISITQCFKEKNYVYAFGHDPEGSGFSLTCTVVLNEGCSADTFLSLGSLSDFLEYYKVFRTSNFTKSIKMTVDGATHTVLLLAQDVSVANAEMHLVNVTFSGKILSND